MVDDVRGTNPRLATPAGGAPGSAESRATSFAGADVQTGTSGRHSSPWGGADFERRRAMLERMMEARNDGREPEKDALRDESRRDRSDASDGDGLGEGFLQRSPPPPGGLAEPRPVEASVPAPLSAGLRDEVAAIERLVRDFNLRDPLLAAHRMSCRLDFGLGFPVTAEVQGTAREIEIRFDVTSELFAQKTGCPVGMMAEALRARFPDLRVHVVFAPSSVADRDEDEPEADA